MVSKELWDILICPYCEYKLQKSKGGALCKNCKSSYNFTSSGALDLRLKKKKEYVLSFTLYPNLNQKTNINFLPLTETKNKKIKNQRFSDELLSYFPSPRTRKSFIIDLGCGSGIDRGACEHLGFNYVGVDYDSKNADILVDMHSLPFKKDSFEIAISFAVMQYSYNPFKFIGEVNRVLKTKGVFIGTVAFLEPFHKTFYHHTHIGLANTLSYGNFKIIRISPSKAWTGLKAQAIMGLFPKMPQFISNWIIFPIRLLHRLWWFFGKIFYKNSTEINRLLYNSGTFTFVAVKMKKNENFN